MGQLVLFVLGWFAIGLLVAVALGKILHEANRLDAHPNSNAIDYGGAERRTRVRRAHDRSSKTFLNQRRAERRQGTGRRSEDRMDGKSSL
jgi:hypothetical protein